MPTPEITREVAAVPQHTPGPWRWENHPYPDGKPYITIEGGREPFGFNSFPHGLRVTAIMSEADARLIVAAPNFADIARRAQYLANTRGGDYAALTRDELCAFMVEYDRVLSKTEERS